jgi:predicted dehydrogenase
MALAAARAGKHVLCEKPQAMNVAECDEMIAASAEANIKLGIAYYRHFYPVVVRIREILASGEIGSPVIGQINAFEYFNPAPSHPRHWLLDKELSGGGPMFDFGCHRIEVLIDLLGPVRRVNSLLSNTLFDRSVEDTATALFEFESGAQGMLSVSHAASEPQDTLSIFGSKGSLHVQTLNEGALKVRVGNDERSEFHPPGANLHLPLIEDFVQAIMSKRNPHVDAAIGREVTRLEAAIYHEGSRSRFAGQGTV